MTRQEYLQRHTEFAPKAAPAPTVEQVEEAVGMGHGAWDCIAPDELIAAVLRLAAATKAAPARWYMVNAVGMATLCVDREDAEQEAKDAQAAWPQMGPHRAVQLVELQGGWNANE